MDYNKLSSEMIKLVKIMEKLRGPDGCPWDKKQDYYSLREYIIEEAYEVVETLQEKNISNLKEELGDLLLQVVFEAQIAREEGDFELIDVFSGINEKLIRRHPHVFGDMEIDNADQVKVTWNNIKKKEKEDDFNKDGNTIIEDYCKGQPAVNQAYEIQKQAAEVGFDWHEVSSVIEKMEEELEEVKAAVRNDNRSEIQAELGDMIFAVVNLARFYNINPEMAVLDTIKKFKDRFKFMEDKSDGLEELSLEEMEQYWERSKTNEREE